jgi:hypothetical protein
MNTETGRMAPWPLEAPLSSRTQDPMVNGTPTNSRAAAAAVLLNKKAQSPAGRWETGIGNGAIHFFSGFIRGSFFGGGGNAPE